MCHDVGSQAQLLQPLPQHVAVVLISLHEVFHITAVAAIFNELSMLPPFFAAQNCKSPSEELGQHLLG